MITGKLYRFEATSPHSLYAERSCIKSIGLVPNQSIVIFLEHYPGKYFDGMTAQIVKVIYGDQVGYIGLVISEKQLFAFFTEVSDDPR